MSAERWGGERDTEERGYSACRRAGRYGANVGSYHVNGGAREGSTREESGRARCNRPPRARTTVTLHEAVYISDSTKRPVPMKFLWQRDKRH